MHCFNTGFSGRIAIGELLEINDDIRTMITEKAHTARVKEVAMAGGMVPMREDGLDKAFRGITTFEEVINQTEEY
jgi:type IV pilus assembly protein PilB